jgi:hypothetical protein
LTEEDVSGLSSSSDDEDVEEEEGVYLREGSRKRVRRAVDYGSRELDDVTSSCS